MILLRPNTKRAPIYPKSLPYPYIPKNTPQSKARLRKEDLELAHSPSSIVSETDSNEASEGGVLKIKNSVTKKRDVSSAESIRKSRRPVKRIENYARESESDKQLRMKGLEETDSGRSSPAAKKPGQTVNKKKHNDIEEANSGRSSVKKKKKHMEVEEATKLDQAAKKKKQKDDEIRSVPQRIENVIEEYEDKVCCVVVLASLSCLVTRLKLRLRSARHDVMDKIVIFQYCFSRRHFSLLL